MSQTPAFAHNPARVIASPPATASRPAATVENRPMIADQERWMRVLQRLRAEVGEEIFKSWFAAMGHDGVEGDTVRLSVPTRFLKSWVQSHYSDKLLACWRAELPSVRRIDLVHRSAVLRTTTAKAKPSEPVETAREPRNGAAERAEARRSIRGWCSTPSWSAAPTRSRMRRRGRLPRRGAAKP
jgi:hypothetical protein